MKLVRYGTRNPLINLFGEIDNWQDDLTHFFGNQVSPHLPVDIVDRKSDFLIKADIPGMNKEDISVSVHEGALVIQGERKEEHEEKKEGRLTYERFYGQFMRTIALPQEVDASRVVANYKNGVLEIVLPKKENAQPKKVTIN